MFSILFFVLFWASCSAAPMVQYYSYSPAVGAGSGNSFATSGQERITAIRIWENNNAYINAIQVRYGYAWGEIFGRKTGIEQTMELFDDEAFVQVSGKYNPGNYIYELVFVTNRGRFLQAGQPQYTSFNFYPSYSGSELRFLSGRTNNVGITSIGAHWGVLYKDQNKGNTT